mmetsp:Transcript_99375/g.290054  ORF Transcript_99375/g.290054 Transcript_99375/m.290054 type:complete len:256 (+) Transcript_99375:36-803(+)
MDRPPAVILDLYSSWLCVGQAGDERPQCKQDYEPGVLNGQGGIISFTALQALLSGALAAQGLSLEDRDVAIVLRDVEQRVELAAMVFQMGAEAITFLDPRCVVIALTVGMTSGVVVDCFASCRRVTCVYEGCILAQSQRTFPAGGMWPSAALIMESVQSVDAAVHQDLWACVALIGECAPSVDVLKLKSDLTQCHDQAVHVVPFAESSLAAFSAASSVFSLRTCNDWQTYVRRGEWEAASAGPDAFKGKTFSMDS